MKTNKKLIAVVEIGGDKQFNSGQEPTTWHSNTMKSQRI